MTYFYYISANGPLWDGVASNSIRNGGNTLKYLHRINTVCHSTKRHSQTRWLHRSQQHLFVPATSSESTALQLSSQSTAPASFVAEALGNPITTIRQSGKLTDTSKSDYDHDFVVML